MTDQEHLTIEQLSAALADRQLGQTLAPDISAHLDGCSLCQAKAKRATVLLDLGASLDAAHETFCPTELVLCDLLDNRVPPQRAAELREHIENCEACNEALTALADATQDTHTAPSSAGARRRLATSPSRPGIRPLRWMGGLALAAAVVLMVTLWPQGGPSWQLALYDGPVQRDGAAPTQEFEITLQVDTPQWVHLLVVDRAGNLTFLTQELVDTETTFGRYAVQPPSAEDPEAERAYALLLIADRELLNDLPSVEVPTEPLFQAPSDARAQMKQLCATLAASLDCECRFKALAEP